MIYDTIIIGKGPAGISAAIYAKRSNLSVLVIGKDAGTLEKAELVENYYGFSQPITGSKLAANGVRQAKRLGVEVKNAEVVGADFADGFVVKTAKHQYKGKSVLFAIGKKRRSAPIVGIDKFEGNGISYCSVCDGFFYRGKNVAVIGSGDYAVAEAQHLKTIAASVTIFTGGEQLKAPAGIEVNPQKILKIIGGERAEKIVTQDGEYAFDGMFVAMGSAGAAEFALKLGIMTQGGNIVIDEHYATNLPGIFAAGDCVGGFAQVAKAVSDGALAANSVIKYVRSLR